ncbi:MAG: hypothetical protein DDT42_01484 [candidate division WS2 bacterium]|uniref:Bacterial toxin RNase RnlA/LsoA DBD domain-containing protein n=1 Tax=Psychracetigena formicireducens TaxID=2986056 RepID=A0A9E2BIZ9_PSYF1|nr:hypothetical protein [Candidatus Psychracetigena formicireducens]
MPKSISNAHRIEQVFENYCKNKNYQVKASEDDNNDWRLEISNIRERTIVTIYHTGSIVIGGPHNSLKEEFKNLKQEIKTNPQSFLEHEITEIKACATRYDIMLLELRTRIKESLDGLEAKLEFIENPKSDVEYRAKITRNGSSLTLTQFNNGTLLLQGKTNKLFDDSCDLIEKIANPSDKEVIARFISSDEKNLEIFAAKYTPALIVLAEGNVKKKIGDVYDYLEPYDKKWFVASECLCLTKIPLPEFSPLVMPASKAFEGFTKKLLVGIGLFEADYFKTKNASFSALYDNNNPKRKTICDKEMHANTMLKKIGVYLDTNRNFMMHSDESKITKVDSQEEAEEKVDSIFRDTKEIFNYFNGPYSLLPK